ncbi:MAG: CAP domain-containing protein [Polyangiales bacterium]
MRWGIACGLLWSVSVAQALPCREDDSLSETAASLLLKGEPVRGPELLRTARAHGFEGVSVHAKESADDEQLTQWLVQLGGDGSLLCGEARSEDRRLVLAARRGGTLTRSGNTLRIELEAGFRAPVLVFESAEGELLRVPAKVATVALPEGRFRRVQLLAETTGGPRPVAELALDAAPTIATPSTAPEGGGTRLRSSEAMLGQLTSYRHEQGLGELRDNQLLSASAQRHAARVCELGRLSHRVEGEDPELRLKREHVSARHVGEVLARAESSDRAFQALLDSPSHRLALGRREFTDVGVGQASDKKGQVCLVLLLAAWPRRMP